MNKIWTKKVFKKKKKNYKTTQTSTGPISFLQRLFSFADHTLTKWNSCPPSLSSLLSLVSCPPHPTLLYSPFPINHLPPLGICCFHRNGSQKSIPVALETLSSVCPPVCLCVCLCVSVYVSLCTRAHVYSIWARTPVSWSDFFFFFLLSFILIGKQIKVSFFTFSVWLDWKHSASFTGRS